MTEKVKYAITTSVLFDMSEPNEVFRSCGVAGYHRYMMDHLDEPLKPGQGFEFFKQIRSNPHADVFICSQNSALTGLRAMRTLHKLGLLPDSSCFTNGASPIPYVKAYGADIFLTTDDNVGREAHLEGIPSSIHALPLTGSNLQDLRERYKEKRELKLVSDSKVATLRPAFSQATQTHYIFDLDCVLFGEESEAFYKTHGLEAYKNYELSKCADPLSKGSYFPFFEKLNRINESVEGSIKPFKISVVTARGAGATLRALNTLHSWGFDLTGEIHFMDGASKGPVLQILQERGKLPTMFFDDQNKNVDAALNAGVFAGRAPSSLDTPPPPSAA